MIAGSGVEGGAGVTGAGVTIVPATAAEWPLLADLFAHRGGPDCRFCWCIYWRLPSKEFSASPTRANRERLETMVSEGPSPGMVAIDDGRAVGWVSLAPRDQFQRIERSRVIPRVDGPMPWSIVCFVVSRDVRGRGVANALLDAAVEFARRSGATALEGYPIDAAAINGKRVRDTGAYVGTRSMFERAGFHLVAETASVSGGAPRVVMRLELG